MDTISVNLKDAKAVGENLKIVKQDDLLIIVVDTTKEIGASSSGKMIGIASTGGFTAVPGQLKMNLYLGRKASV